MILLKTVKKLQLSTLSQLGIQHNKNPIQPASKMFLCQIEVNVFLLLPGNTTRYNLTMEEWLGMRRLAEYRNIVIKTADKYSYVVVWDRVDYLLEGKQHLIDKYLGSG